MGNLTPFCIVTDNIRFYSFSRETGNQFGDTFVLVKSNDGPSVDLKDLSWTLISAVPIKGLAPVLWFNEIEEYNCAIDDTGVFSVISSCNLSEDIERIPWMIVGLQYQPSLTTGGEGTWRNITIPSDYLWKDEGYNELFYFKDSMGKNNLMHSFIPENNDLLFVATFNPVTMTMEQGPSWNVSKYTPYNNVATTFTNNSIHLWVENWPSGRWISETAFLYSIPITSPSNSPPSIMPSGFNVTTIFVECNGSALRRPRIKPFGDKLIIFCLEIEPPKLFIYDGKSIQTITVIRPGLYSKSIALVPFSGYSTGYLLACHEFEGVYSIPLNGSSPGSTRQGALRISIPEKYGTPISTSANPSTPTTSLVTPTDPAGSNGNSGLSRINAGLIGGIGACIIIIVVVVALGYRNIRRNKKMNSADETMITKENTFGSNHGIEVEVKENRHQQNPQSHESNMPERSDDIWEWRTMEPMSTTADSTTLPASTPSTLAIPQIPLHTRPTSSVNLSVLL
ncbi:hypothetical protein BGZ76_000141 [Entomortierella beljakovae]|nr:hypothetical protein BGZ76_000141 [Entomortierella beljakovae]